VHPGGRGPGRIDRLGRHAAAGAGRGGDLLRRLRDARGGGALPRSAARVERSLTSDVVAHDRDPDGNGIFDEGNGLTTRIEGPWGQGNNFNREVSVSRDGRWVVFETDASNFVSGDFNGKPDVFRYDRVSGTLELVTRSWSGGVADKGGTKPSISGDGNLVAFASNSTDLTPTLATTTHIYVRDMAAGLTTMVSLGPGGVTNDGSCNSPSISADGTAVSFDSRSTNLHPLDTDTFEDVYVRDLVADTTDLVSVSSLGVKSWSPSGWWNCKESEISDDGQRVAFRSNATNLTMNATRWTDVFLFDRGTRQMLRASIETRGWPGNAESAGYTGLDISGDGRAVVFESESDNLVDWDTNDQGDIFVHQTCKNVAIELGYGLEGGSHWTATLGVCGSLASGDTALARVVLGAEDARGVLFVSTVSNPRPFYGGTLVPDFPMSPVGMSTDDEGVGTAILSGGGGPQDLYLQWACRDSGAIQGVGLSNAVRITLLP